jgi:hypothetical protein
VYTPPTAGAVSSIITTTVTITAEADNTVTKPVFIQIVPVSSDGKLHISLGKQSGTPYPVLPNYTDTTGVVWWNDLTQGPPIDLFPDGVTVNGPYVTWTDYSGTNAYAFAAPPIYRDWLGAYNDLHFRIHVPNGQVTGTVLPANGAASAPNMSAFSFDCNGVPEVGQTDLYNFTGGLYIGRPLTCTQTVTDSVLHMVLRRQGVNPGLYDGCSVACYQLSNVGPANFAAGLVVSPGSIASAAH